MTVPSAELEQAIVNGHHWKANGQPQEQSPLGIGCLNEPQSLNVALGVQFAIGLHFILGGTHLGIIAEIGIIVVIALGT
jgi:hypothetical protein